ncbi:MAG: signal peptidase I [Actinobacteria bacterium]|nr:signal peptidase I [Actinomycetota bacterium]
MSENTKDNSGKAKKITREVIGYLIAIISAVVIAVLIRTFIFEPFIVPTPSMEPTLMVGDKVIINKLSYNFTDVERGDIIAFHSPIEENKELVKRAIAVEGDEISLTSEGEIFINGERLDEDYLPGEQDIKYLNQEITVGQDEVFVMGDNRNNSFDSRFFGNISEDRIFGEFVIIYWPPSRW